MTPILARVLQLTACLVGAVHRRLDRLARDLTGASDDVAVQPPAEARRIWLDEPRRGEFRSLGARRALAVQHRPVGGVLAVPTLAYVELVDEQTGSRALGDVLTRYYPPDEVADPRDADDLVALLERDGLMLARRIG